MSRPRVGRVLSLALIFTASHAADSAAQMRMPAPAETLGKSLAAFRASPVYALSRIRLRNVQIADRPFSEALEWLNREVSANAGTNAPRIRIEVRPLEIAVPSHTAALETVITASVERLRAADATWREEIASNALRRVKVEGVILSALDVLKDCCTQADLQYADDGRDVVVGNVYFLRWPPAIACRVLPVSAKLVKSLGERVKDLVAPAQFHDSRRDWMVLAPEQNALVVFHHPDMLDALTASVEFANANADELANRPKPAPPIGEK